MTALRHRFSIPVTVIVPIYNAPRFLSNLIESLARTIPKAIPGLTFTFVDDGSTDPQMPKALLNPFLARADVTLHRRLENKGFIATVNEAISKAGSDSDIVLLNSDTEIWDEVFSTLQIDAYSCSNIASVTPLTNKGTIASLFFFPHGGNIPKPLTPCLISSVVSQLSLPTPRIPAPTGNGFCMYMKRHAINDIGLLDPIYGRGYGEECDWCQRAIKGGWIHLISPSAFVHHVGTQSFLSEFKQSLIERNSQVLLSRYPEYHSDVAAYVKNDPLWLLRVEILLELYKAQLGNRSRVVITSKDKESLLSRASSQSNQSEHLSLGLVPETASLYCLRGTLQGTLYFEERLHRNCLPGLLSIIRLRFEGFKIECDLISDDWPFGAFEKSLPFRCGREESTTSLVDLMQDLRQSLMTIDQLSRERDELLHSQRFFLQCKRTIVRAALIVRSYLGRFAVFKKAFRVGPQLIARVLRKHY